VKSPVIIKIFAAGIVVLPQKPTDGSLAKRLRLRVLGQYYTPFMTLPIAPAHG
jgi:hypothetical protein